MKVALSKIGPEATQFDLDWPADYLEKGADLAEGEGILRPLDRIKGWVSIKPLGQPVEESDLILQGRIKTRVGGECDRCLKEFGRDLDLGFRVVLVRSLGEITPEKELRGEELNHSLLEGDEIDLRRIVLEQLILESDMVNLCSEECRGLCPNCGADLNQGPCGCKDNEIDPRLAALAGWRPDKNKKE